MLLADVPDPVFAQAIVGPGLAVVPAGSGSTAALEQPPSNQPPSGQPPGIVAVSPIAGTLFQIHPHAFIVLSDGGQGILVHLGIDTVELDGQGFDMLAAQGDRLAAGDAVIRWDPAAVEAGGRSAVVPVIALDAGSLANVTEAGQSVTAGSLLYAVGS